MRKDEIEKIICSSDFFNFLNREFEKTANIATIEEIAEFAFGPLEEAINNYKEISGAKNETI